MGLFLSLVLIFVTVTGMFFALLYTALLNKRHGLKAGDMPVAGFSLKHFIVSLLASVLLGQVLFALLFGGVIGVFVKGTAS